MHTSAGSHTRNIKHMLPVLLCTAGRPCCIDCVDLRVHLPRELGGEVLLLLGALSGIVPAPLSHRQSVRPRLGQLSWRIGGGNRPVQPAAGICGRFRQSVGGCEPRAEGGAGVWRSGGRDGFLVVSHEAGRGAALVCCFGSRLLGAPAHRHRVPQWAQFAVEVSGKYLGFWLGSKSSCRQQRLPR